jgi:hypothetical protein
VVEGSCCGDSVLGGEVSRSEGGADLTARPATFSACGCAGVAAVAESAEEVSGGGRARAKAESGGERVKEAAAGERAKDEVEGSSEVMGGLSRSGGGAGKRDGWLMMSSFVVDGIESNRASTWTEVGDSRAVRGGWEVPESKGASIGADVGGSTGGLGGESRSGDEGGGEVPTVVVYIGEEGAELTRLMLENASFRFLLFDPAAGEEGKGGAVCVRVCLTVCLGVCVCVCLAYSLFKCMRRIAYGLKKKRH